MTQHIAHGEELWLVVLDHAAVRRYTYLAVGKGIEGVDGLIARYAWCQVYLDFNLGCCEVFNLTGLDFSFFDGLYDRVLQGL